MLLTPVVIHELSQFGEAAGWCDEEATNTGILLNLEMLDYFCTSNDTEDGQRDP